MSDMDAGDSEDIELIEREPGDRTRRIWSRMKFPSVSDVVEDGAHELPAAKKKDLEKALKRRSLRQVESKVSYAVLLIY